MTARGSLNLPTPSVRAYAWQQLAQCRTSDPEHFFTEDRDQQDRRRVSKARDAHRLCHGCPVIDQCLTHALSVPEDYGIWGGTTAAERRRLLNKQPAA